MEYIKSDLDQILKNEVELKNDHIIKILYTSLCSLSFVHATNIMHRDLKSANILVNETCTGKVCDFGLSRTIPTGFMEFESNNSLRLRERAQ